jgi:hypothetical protein
MFDYEPKPEKQSPDYTGLIIGAVVTPIFFVFLFFDRPELGLATCIVLGMAMLAVRLRWELRKHIWFWATVLFLLALHVPLLSMFRVPKMKAPTIVYTFPLGAVDFAIFLLTIGFVEDIVCKFFPAADD